MSIELVFRQWKGLTFRNKTSSGSQPHNNLASINYRREQPIQRDYYAIDGDNPSYLSWWIFDEYEDDPLQVVLRRRVQEAQTAYDSEESEERENLCKKQEDCFQQILTEHSIRRAYRRAEAPRVRRWIDAFKIGFVDIRDVPPCHRPCPVHCSLVEDME